MAESRPASKPVLPKPPGYRDPAAPPPAAPKPPPRRQPLPPAYRQAGKPIYNHRDRRDRRGRSRSCCCRLCCCLAASALAAAFLITVAGAVAYLWFQPRFPSFRLQSVNATYLRVDTSDSLDAAVAVRILASNPNKRIGVEYADGEGRVAIADVDGDVDAGSAAIAGFEQGKKNRTVVRFQATAKGVAVDDVTGSRIRAEFRGKDIRFVVEVRTRLGFVVGGKSTGKLPIRVKCEAVSLRQGAGGRPLPKCKIFLLRWINLH